MKIIKLGKELLKVCDCIDYELLGFDSEEINQLLSYVCNFIQCFNNLILNSLYLQIVLF